MRSVVWKIAKREVFPKIRDIFPKRSVGKVETSDVLARVEFRMRANSSIWPGCAAEVKGRSLRVNRESAEKGVFPSSESRGAFEEMSKPMSKSEAQEKNLIEAFLVIREALSPNQTPEPTALLVMSRAFARATPIRAVAHL
jgi:hypothetical protein